MTSATWLRLTGATDVSRFRVWHMGFTCLLLLYQCVCPTGVVSLNPIYKPCQSASLTFHLLPRIVISQNSSVAFLIFLKFSLFNTHSVMALETHTFLTLYSVDASVAERAVCTIGLIHGAKTCPGLIQLACHTSIHLCSPALSSLHLHFQEKEVLANRPEEC